jgi:putative hemolysin
MLADLGVELAIILALTLANGFFAGSETAFVSSRRSRLEAEANSGKRAAKQALELADNPDRFLATVQVGITLIGTFSAAFGGARIGDILTVWLQSVPPLAPYAETIALAVVVITITYISLILGELVPKRLALRNAEGLAIFAAPIMTVLSSATRPIIALLTGSVNVVMRLVGQQNTTESGVSEEDITYMLREGTQSGAVEAGEARFIQRVFQFTDRPVRSVMTPRTEVVAVDVDTPLGEVVDQFLASKVSRIPVYEGQIDHAIGIIHAKDLLRYVRSQVDEGNEWKQLILPTIFVLETAHIDDVLGTFRQKGIHMAMVVDEYGQTSGIITLEDLLEELVGEIRDEHDQGEEHPIVQRADGSWLVDGMEAYDKVRDRIGLPELDEADFTTIAGLILSQLSRIPVEGDTILLGNYILEVVDMDARRVDKVLVRPVQKTTPSSAD